MAADVKHFQMLRAAKKGRLHEVQHLLEHGHSLLDAHTRCTRTPLFVAATGGRFVVVEFLLDQGADIDFHIPQRGGGETALGAACFQSRVEVVALLLQRGANVIISRDGGWTVLHDAVLSVSGTIVKMLLTHGGCSLDAQNDRGETCLHLACAKGSTDMVVMLLNAGVDPSLRVTTCYLGDIGMTSVDLARSHGHDEIVQHLKEWERAYWMVRVRHLRDVSASSTAMPLYLRKRAARYQSLPAMTVVRKHGKRGWATIAKADLDRSVVAYALEWMKKDVHEELMAMLGLTKVQGGVRVEGHWLKKRSGRHVRF